MKAPQSGVPEWQAILDSVGFESRGDTNIAKLAYHLWVLIRQTSGSFRILLNGPTGTGKESMAKGVHGFQPRTIGNFVVVNCPLLMEATAHTSLFGAKIGSFTDQKEEKKGSFELAAHAGDTIFLDEVDKLPPPVRSQLYRVLHERTYERFGESGVVRPFHGNVVAASSASADQFSHHFPQELLSRLAETGEVQMPGLNERKEEHRRALIDHGLRHWIGGKILMDDDVRAFLLREDFPRNVRGLKTTMNQLACYAKEDAESTKKVPTMTMEHLGVVQQFQIQPSFTPKHEKLSEPASETITLEQAELMTFKEMLMTSIGRHGINQSVLAREMGINRNTLREKIRRLSEQEEIEAGTYLASLLRDLLQRVLSECAGNRQLAAAKLKIPVRTLYNWMGKTAILEGKNDTNQGVVSADEKVVA